MNVEDISKKNQEYQSKLLKYKLNIERFLQPKQQSQEHLPLPLPAPINSNPSMGSSVFRALQDESLVVSDTSRPADNTLFESGLVASNLHKERNIINEIDSIMGRIRSKGPALPVEAYMRSV